MRTTLTTPAMRALPTPRTIRALPAMLALLATTMAPSSGQANGPEVGWDGGHLVPVEKSIIFLVGEVVDVTLEGEGYPGGRVHVTYWLANPVPQPMTINMTFLLHDDQAYGHSSESRRDYDFSVSIGDSLVPLRWAPAAIDKWTEFGITAPDTLPVWTIQIPGRTTLSVEMGYAVEPSGGADGMNYGHQFRYLTRSACLWAGPIEFAQFRIHTRLLPDLLAGRNPILSECDSVRISPPGWFVDAGVLTWRFEDWEPDADITLDLDCVEATGVASFIDGEARQMMPQYDGDYRFVSFGKPGVPYAGESQPCVAEDILEQIRDAFASLAPVRRRPGNYIPFAVAFLTWRRNEIDARQGRIFIDHDLQYSYNRQGWYRGDSAWTPDRRSPVARDNRILLSELESRITRDPTVLLPLPTNGE